MKFPEKIFPSHFRKTPLIISVVASLIVIVCFYFVDQGVAAMSSHPEMTSVYGEYLSLAKWLIVAGFLVRGIISGLKKS